MAKNVVSLTVHRNTKRRRERRDMRKNMVSDAKFLSSRDDLAAYVIVAIGESTNASCALDTGRKIPLRYLPELCKAIVSVEAESVHSHDGDDYLPDED